MRREFGVNFEQLDPAALRKREPYLTGNFVGGLLMLDPVSVTDLHATIYHLLGLNPRLLEVPGRKRLDMDYGTPIHEIIA